VRNRFRELAGSMAIDVLDYAILDNHLLCCAPESTRHCQHVVR
jgi:hypothetical protein